MITVLHADLLAALARTGRADCIRLRASAAPNILRVTSDSPIIGHSWIEWTGELLEPWEATVSRKSVVEFIAGRNNDDIIRLDASDGCLVIVDGSVRGMFPITKGE